MRAATSIWSSLRKVDPLWITDNDEEGFKRGISRRDLAFSWNCLMAQYLDLANWARRDVFEFFRGFDKPYFNICTRLDVTNLLALVRGRSDLGVSLAYHYFSLRVANEMEPFRYRLREG